MSQELTQHVQQSIQNSVGKLLGGGNQITAIEAIIGGVSGSINGVVSLKSQFSEAFPFKRLVAKFAPGVGKRERYGSGILKEHLNDGLCVGPFVNINDPDLHLSRYIPGLTLHQMVQIGGIDRWPFFRQVAIANRDMWLNTLDENNGDCTSNYIQKIEDTRKLLLQTEIICDNYLIPVSELCDFQLVLNGKRLPSISGLFDEMSAHIKGTKTFATQHGDEGAGNYIIYDDTIYVVDNEKVGKRPIGEGIAKLTCWFPAILCATDFFNASIKHDSLHIDGKPMVPSHTKLLAQNSVQLIKNSDVTDYIDPEAIRAFCACYFFREIQWLTARGREGAKMTIFEMALHQLMCMHEKTDW